MDIDLHRQVDEFKISWTKAVIVHALIDLGRVTALECQAPECICEIRTFITAGNLRHPLAMALDHIMPQRLGGSHRLENLRLVHNRCNWAWRRGIKGSHLSDEARARLSAQAFKQHAEGRGPDYTNASRNAKISAAMKAKPPEWYAQCVATRRRNRKS